MAHVGTRTARLEDGRLLRGAGTFIDDVDLPGQLWLRIVRSELAHARLTAVDVAAAVEAPGVRAVVTGADLADVEPIPLRLFEGFGLEPFLQPVLARDRVRYVGEPVAAVVAENPYAAEDAAELVAVAYDALAPALDARDALAPDASSLWDGRTNEAARLEKRYGDVEAAFAAADQIVAAEFRVGRHTGAPLETRGLAAAYEAGRGHLTVWGATLVTHYHRRVLSRLLGLPLSRIHMRSTDAGGNFGVRGDFYPEDFLVPHLAIACGRPVKWIEDRVEHMVATNHGREQIHRIEGAFAADGRLLALRDEVWTAKGGYIRPTGVVVSELTIGMLPGPYRVPAYEATVHAVTTNKTPIGPYRGPGRYQATFARERLLDVAADELGLDPVAIRRANLVTPAEIPYEPGLPIAVEPFVLDSGAFPQLLDQAIEAFGYDDWRREAEELRREGRPVGCGLAYFMDKSGLGVYETAAVEVDVSGGVRVLTGGSSSGQGIETVLAQIAADALGVAPSAIEVLHGDTDLVPDGVGSWSSRSTVIGGSAVALAAREAAAKARRVAAELLEASADDLLLDGGRVQVAGSPERGLALAEVARACDAVSSAARGEEPGLGARSVYVDERMNYPYGLVLVQVEVDPETAGIALRRAAVAYEVGRAVNPMLIEGQITGGLAQGVGGALLEELRYDADGQLRSSSFLDYLLPTAAELVEVRSIITEQAPTPTNPLGAKGAGEAGIIGCGGAIANAVADALGDARAVTRLPLDPDHVRELLLARRNERPAERAPTGSG